jgi:hypothetical protein
MYDTYICFFALRALKSPSMLETGLRFKVIILPGSVPKEEQELSLLRIKVYALFFCRNNLSYCFYI